MTSFSYGGLVEDIIKNAHAVGIPPGSAEIFAEKTALEVEKWLENRTKVTQTDLDRVISKKLSAFSKDLAFFYKNHGKII